MIPRSLLRGASFKDTKRPVLVGFGFEGLRTGNFTGFVDEVLRRFPCTDRYDQLAQALTF